MALQALTAERPATPGAETKLRMLMVLILNDRRLMMVMVMVVRHRTVSFFFLSRTGLS
jgi:uncharacterized membrane protein YwzB